MNATADAFFGIFGMKRVEQPVKLDVVVPIEVSRGLNDREHYRVRAKRVKAERQATYVALFDGETRAARHIMFVDGKGARVTLLRPFARVPLDSDNLSGAFKGVRDEVASFLGVDDKSDRVHWRYCQTKAMRVQRGFVSALDTHIRIRIEILPAADVDPLLTAVRVLREAAQRVKDNAFATPQGLGYFVGNFTVESIAEALATADALATFDPMEMYR